MLIRSYIEMNMSHGDVLTFGHILAARVSQTGGVFSSNQLASRQENHAEVHIPV